MFNFNSILIAYRDRPKHLECCLKSIARCHHKHRFDIQLVDLGSKADTAAILRPFREQMEIVHHAIPYAGPFHKSKALNYALNKSDTEYVTILDVDMLVEETFLKFIEEHFQLAEAEADAEFEGCVEPHDIKLSHRCLLLPQNITETIHNNFDLFNSYVQPNLTSIAKEMHLEVYDDVELGTGNFTMNRDRLIELGGYHESFRGYGMEDQELNWRLWQHAIFTDLNEWSLLAHQWHGREADWYDPAAIQKNQALFQKRKEDGFSIPERKRTWGLFNGKLEPVGGS